MDTIKEVPWFSDGLKFKCTGCGKCCTGSDGYVYLSSKDVDNLSTHLNLPPKEFTKTYTRFIRGDYALKDQPKSGDCIFLKNNQCSVYESRPIQCRTFPWWVQNIRGPEEWEAAATHCEGINHPDAPIIPSAHIEEQCLSHIGSLLENNFK
jgi:hypothetical protein